MLTVYHYPKCSTCRNALRWMDARGIRHERVDIVETPPSIALLRQALDRSALPIARLFNTSGQSYRQGNYKERLLQMSRDEALAALAADGKLIKRPLVISSHVTLVGFDERQYGEALDALRSTDGDERRSRGSRRRRCPWRPVAPGRRPRSGVGCRRVSASLHAEVVDAKSPSAGWGARAKEDSHPARVGVPAPKKK